MKFKDSLRAQYYLRLAHESLSKILEELIGSGLCATRGGATDCTDTLLEQMSDESDQIILPVVAFALNEAKQGGRLVGRNSKERYDSFFISGNQWSQMALGIIELYPHAMTMVRRYWETATNNVLECLKRLSDDNPLLEKLGATRDNNLTGIKVLGSDRHRVGRQALLLTFGHDLRIVYKPASLAPEKLYAQFLGMIDLPRPFDLMAPLVVDRDDYGWIGFIDYRGCENLAQVSNYYRRSGVLLAVSDCLNYCDGHFDNLIAHGEYPVLIDCETLFHVLPSAASVIEERSILYTGLIEKAPKKGELRGFTAALQTPIVNRLELLHPNPIRDHTDRLEVRFRGVSDETTHNCPILNGVGQTPHGFIKEVSEGYSFAYDLITERSKEILQTKAWWESVVGVKVRQLIRHTLYYAYLIRRIQQPECCSSEAVMQKTLFDLLLKDNSPLVTLVNYESQDLVQLDIPYFYHYPGYPDLYRGDDIRIDGYFQETAVDQLRRNFLVRSSAYRDRMVDIIRNVLPQSPVPGKATYRKS